MTRQTDINNEPIVSVAELNAILSIPLAAGMRISVQFLHDVAKMDIVFLAGLLLHHAEYKTTFSVNYRNSLGDRMFELRNYLKQYQSLYGVRYTEVFGDDFIGLGNVDAHNLTGSESYAPILLVNDQTIGALFTHGRPEKPAGAAEHGLTAKLRQLQPNYTKDIDKNTTAALESDWATYPPLYAIVFSVVYHKMKAVSRAKGEKGLGSLVPAELWEFTLQYMTGLHELAKNIVEHSSGKTGMITIRAYDAEAEGDTGKVLETHVFDYGTTGILQSLRQHTATKKGTNPLYDDDLKILDGPYKLKDFIKPTPATLLHQQMYRELAHYGLAKFYKLIEHNDGSIVSSTVHHPQRDDYHTNKALLSKAINAGTAYYFQLPFKPELFRVDSVPKSDGQLQGSTQTIDSLSTLAAFSVRDAADEHSAGTMGQHVLLNFNLSLKVNDRTDEQQLFDAVKKHPLARQVDYLSVNFAAISISSSALLRFLAQLSQHFDVPAIVYNLQAAVYLQALDENKLFCEMMKGPDTEAPYWFEEKGVLVFSRIGMQGGHFHFADLLYGKTEHDFRAANYLISHTFPNTSTIVGGTDIKHKDFSPQGILSRFFYQSSLLPFDLLLMNDGQRTLFQANLELLINQDLNPS